MKFKQGESKNQPSMFPATIEEYIPEKHLAKLVCSIVSLLNLDEISKKYSTVGQYPYDPEIILAILFYGYAIGLRSSRKLSQACIDRLDFMYIAAKLQPSYKTISEFRKNNIENLSALFQEIILIAIKLGLTQIGNIKVSIDGTKIRANASGKLSKDEEGLKKILSEVEKKVSSIMSEAEQIDQKEDTENKQNDKAEELKKLSTKKSKIEQAIKDLKKEKAELKAALIAKKQKTSKTGEDVKLTQKEEEKIEKKKINLTDPDAKYMKEREGCIKTNYNCQASVEEENQIILAAEITTNPNDKNQLQPMLEKTEQNIESKIKLAKADSGYLSGSNLSKAALIGVEVIIDDPSIKRIDKENHIYDKVNFKYDAETDTYICPEEKPLNKKFEKDGKSLYKCNSCTDCPVKKDCTKSSSKTITRDQNETFIELNREKLQSDEGKKEYKKRMHTVEPVFGNLKFNLGFRQFLVRGVKKVQGEFNLMCIAHNIKKILSFNNKNNMNLKTCLA